MTGSHRGHFQYTAALLSAPFLWFGTSKHVRPNTVTGVSEPEDTLAGADQKQAGLTKIC